MPRQRHAEFNARNFYTAPGHFVVYTWKTGRGPKDLRPSSTGRCRVYAKLDANCARPAWECIVRPPSSSAESNIFIGLGGVRPRHFVELCALHSVGLKELARIAEWTESTCGQAWKVYTHVPEVQDKHGLGCVFTH